MASTMRLAWCPKNTRLAAAKSNAWAISPKDALTRLATVSGNRLGIAPEIAGSSDGTMPTRTMNPVHAAASPAGKRLQPRKSAHNVAMGVIDRLRLSSIFQMPRAGIPCIDRQSSNHGNSCQSPRTQRCCRAAATP